MPDDGFLTRHAQAGIAAASEALFPVNDYGAPDHRTTDMVRRMNEYLALLPAEQRRLITWLFVAVELGAILLMPGFRRFSRHAAERRCATVRGWRRSRWLALRVLGDAVKATMTVIYMSHPAALAHIGAYKTCARPDDPLPFRVEPDALSRMTLE